MFPFLLLPKLFRLLPPIPQLLGTLSAQNDLDQGRFLDALFEVPERHFEFIQPRFDEGSFRIRVGERGDVSLAGSED